MRRTTTILLAVTALALAGCSSGGDDPKPAATKTVTAAPSLSAAEQKKACVDAWLVVLTADGYDADSDLATPAECGGLSGQADMYAEALRARNQANRDSLGECLEDPSCTDWPLPTP